MRRRYRATIGRAERYFDTSEWVLDSIKLEADFASKKAANKMIKKFVKERFNDSILLTKPFEENLEWLKAKLAKGPSHEKPSIETPKFRSSSLIKQRYSLPYPIVNYLSKSANYAVTRKLQFCAKHLFLCTNTTLFLKVSLTELSRTQIHDEAIFVSAKNPNVDKINNIFLVNTLLVYYFEKADVLSKFIPKIAKCELRYLMIVRQNLCLEEYMFLVKAGKIKRIYLNYTTVKINDCELASLEALMEPLPRAEVLK